MFAPKFTPFFHLEFRESSLAQKKNKFAFAARLTVRSVCSIEANEIADGVFYFRVVFVDSSTGKWVLDI